MEWDIFISHASEDKDSFVRQLATELQNRGVKVFYDEFSLKLGDSLNASIDRGLSESRFGIVVLSKHFFNKNWTKRELAGLVARETSGEGKIILPLWHDITLEEVRIYSPPLADIIAVDTSRGIDYVISKILEIVQITTDNKETPSKNEVTLDKEGFSDEQIKQLQAALKTETQRQSEYQNQVLIEREKRLQLESLVDKLILREGHTFINYGQAGAMGDNAHVHDSVLNQIIKVEKIVTFASWQTPYRDPETDRLIWWFDFSVVDSSLIGTPREHVTKHSIKITMTEELRDKWGLETSRGSSFSNDLLKVAFQFVLDNIENELKKGSLPEGELLPLLLTTNNSPSSCPYTIANIAYPEKTSFTVTLQENKERINKYEFSGTTSFKEQKERLGKQSGGNRNIIHVRVASSNKIEVSFSGSAGWVDNESLCIMFHLEPGLSDAIALQRVEEVLSFNHIEWLALINDLWILRTNILRSQIKPVRNYKWLNGYPVVIPEVSHQSDLYRNERKEQTLVTFDTSENVIK